MGILEDRKAAKELRAKYKEKAAEICSKLENVTIPSISAIQLMEDGAFVEAMIWVPKDSL